MPNWCSNILVTTGEPESVEEFKIINSQFIPYQDNEVGAAIQNKSSLSGNQDLGAISSLIVNNRLEGDISFSSLVDGIGSNVWGTKWDIAGDPISRSFEKGAWHISDDLKMERIKGSLFDTAWCPPDRWLNRASEIFPSLRIFMSYEESGNGDYGIISAFGGDISDERSDSRGIRKLLPIAKQNMPLYRKPNSLLKFIWEDDSHAIQNEIKRKGLSQIDLDIKSRWTPLMHAAYAGSKKVTDILLEYGADPFKRLELGEGKSFGANDICFEINSQMPANISLARQEIFIKFMAVDNSFAAEKLATGLQPVQIAFSYQMGLALGSASKISGFDFLIQEKDEMKSSLQFNKLSKFISEGGIIEVLNSFNTTEKKEFCDKFSNYLLYTNSHRSNNIDDAICQAKSFALLDKLGFIEECNQKVAMGQEKFKSSGYFVDGNFSSVINSETSKRFIEEMLVKSNKNHYLK